jgi:hypothetical protein
MNNTQEKPVKTISDVKKMHLTHFFNGIKIDFRTKNCQKMALKSIKRLILSIDGASIKINAPEPSPSERHRLATATHIIFILW